MFAPNHQAVADELVRVCRPGGTIGMLNFTPEGLAAGFFGALAPYALPPPPGAPSPLMWGSEDHVRELFSDRVESLAMTREEYVERADSPRGYWEFCKETFGPRDSDLRRPCRRARAGGARPRLFGVRFAHKSRPT
jgi:hypothetical protein